MKNYKLLPLITAIFAATLMISNTLDTKIFDFFGILAMPAGVILFPLGYVFGDVLTEVYGYKVARKVIWTGFLTLVIMIVFYEIAIRLKPAGFWQNQEAFETIFGHVFRIVGASITAYLVGEFSNSYIVAKLKLKTSGKGMATRFVLSTLVGQALDTIVFVAIAFTGTMGFKDLAFVTFSAWLFKVAWEVLALPITIPVVKLIKKIEQEDYFDKETDFNPFKLRE